MRPEREARLYNCIKSPSARRGPHEMGEAFHAPRAFFRLINYPRLPIFTWFTNHRKG
jgi:hypothetical protein